MLLKLLQKIKENQRDIVLSAVIILITVISFQSGKISALKNRGEAGVEIREASLGEIFVQSSDQTKNIRTESTNSNKADFRVVASKNSNKYHFSWCAGAGKISDKNKISFPTEAAAIAAGYLLASNCKK
ncbi:MAG: hypothetical protein HYT63_02145 [Candidatus Yanofskybacteria bacterium]|nr:hypothetical protein [Candidatus Yanofskybacteria bacterium]